MRELIYRKGHPILLPSQHGKSPVNVIAIIYFFRHVLHIDFVFKLLISLINFVLIIGDLVWLQFWKKEKSDSRYQPNSTQEPDKERGTVALNSVIKYRKSSKNNTSTTVAIILAKTSERNEPFSIKTNLAEVEPNHQTIRKPAARG